MDKILEIVFLFGRYREDRRAVVARDPALVVALEAFEIFIGKILFETAPAFGDALFERAYRTFEIDQDVGWADDLEHRFVEIAVRSELILRHVSLPIQVVRKDFRVFIDRAVLHDGAVEGIELAMDAELVREEMHLRVERPALHVLEEMREERIQIVRLEKGLQPEVRAQKINKARFTGADITRDGDVFGSHMITCTTRRESVHSLNISEGFYARGINNCAW